MHLHPDPRLIPSLLTELRDAWEKDRDVTLIHRLASAHPDLADTLYDYIDLLVQITLDEQAPDQTERDRFTEHTRAWFEVSPASSSYECEPVSGTSRPLLVLLREKSGLRAPEAARKLGVTGPFLSKASRHARELPEAWGDEIAARAQRVFRIPRDQTLDSYHSGMDAGRMAASRATPLHAMPVTPLQVLDAGGITDPEERALWLRLAAAQDV